MNDARTSAILSSLETVKYLLFWISLCVGVCIGMLATVLGILSHRRSGDE